MVKVENLQLNILEVSANTVSFELILDCEITIHKAKIVDNQGIFGVEFPKTVSLILSCYPKETKSFVRKLREKYFAVNERQAA